MTEREKPEARARVAAEAIEAHATGANTAAAASRGAAIAEGGTSAAAGADQARASALSPAAEALVEQTQELSAPLQTGMRKALSALQQMTVLQAQVKETVDDLYALHFAKQLREGSGLEPVLKALLKTAARLAVGELAEAVGALGHPK